jgi:hypothetical protein
MQRRFGSGGERGSSWALYTRLGASNKGVGEERRRRTVVVKRKGANGSRLEGEKDEAAFDLVAHRRER